MRDPSFYAPRRTRSRKKQQSRNNGDTNVTCGCLLFIFLLMAALARHGWLYQESVREFVSIFGGA